MTTRTERASLTYEDILGALHADPRFTAATMDDTGGGCLAIRLPLHDLGPEAEVLITDGEDNLPADRADHSGWTVGVYLHDGDPELVDTTDSTARGLLAILGPIVDSLGLFCANCFASLDESGIYAAHYPTHDGGAVGYSCGSPVTADASAVAKLVDDIRSAYGSTFWRATFLTDPGGWIDYLGLGTDDETALAAIEAIRAEAPSVVGREARCHGCGETFNPTDDTALELEHAERVDGTPCGARGVMVGGMGMSASTTFLVSVTISAEDVYRHGVQAIADGLLARLYPVAACFPDEIVAERVRVTARPRPIDVSEGGE